MTTIDTRMHQSWLCQLSREYDDIRYQYRLALRPPILTINMHRKQMGSWSAANRTLTLSHFLLAGYPWTTTLQVLKHEIAHQVCSEIHLRDDAGHGPLFREACNRIGLDPVFHRPSADLADGLQTTPQGSSATQRGRHIIDKARKLMALGSSENEHEAALAVRRATELLARHRLDFAALAATADLEHRTINTGIQTLPAHRRMICAILEACFSVRVICASLYDPHANVCHRTIEVLGRAELVAMAEHCYHFLEDRLQVLWKKNRSLVRGQGDNGRIAKKSYYLGLLAGFRQTLESAPMQVPPVHGCQPASSMPACREQQALDTFVAYRFPRLRTMRSQSGSFHNGAYQQALAAGRELTLHPPVQDGPGANLRLPPKTQPS
ncbi:DUF2786 domain-containing protein [Desulfobulbus alkaliphilus]|uniref:DUF2786 domain-containing protein n=1 Tax=Desulfobulbus alkaliphilus TaxID=869814 RepID=UPI0019664D77|nr:DUF2786 domain-containing protein [Desulfobulbus alkaliphilus]MBM9537037.1 DUF2786 domain-containing protein [Desulfobulbus alkaliphilus]